MNWVFYALTTAVIFGFQNIITKKILQKEHSVEYLSILYLTSFIFLLPFIKNVNILSLKIIFLVLIRTVLMATSMLFFIKSLKHMPISTVTPLGNLIPFFSLIFGFVLLNEVIGIFQIIGVFVLIFGSYILSTEGHIKKAHEPLKKLFSSKYMFFILMYTLFMALVAIMSKIILNRGISSLDLLFYHNGFSSIIFIGITFIVYDGMKDLKEGYSIAGMWIVIIAIFGTLGAYTKLLALSDPLGKVSLVIPFIRLRGLISTVFGGALFHEKYILHKAIACVLMLVGVGLIVV